MKNRIKTIVKNIVGANGIKKISKIRNYLFLITNFMRDFQLYVNHSAVFEQEELCKKECQLILDYHSVEKGLLFKKTKPRFAQFRILNLHASLNSEVIKLNVERSQIRVAYQVMCEYYELHQRLQVDISDYYTPEQYFNYKSILGASYDSGFKGAINYGRDNFYAAITSDFATFSHSRKSVRQYTGELVPRTTIEQAVSLALNTPSVCNRQACKVYLLEDKLRVDKLLDIQGGLAGYTRKINQVLLLTVDRNYFYTIGERNQFYIDGGMFLMNLLYSLHYHKIANCPANWAKTSSKERKLNEILELKDSEKIMCIIPIGVAESNFSVTLSKRRSLSEVFFEI